MNKARRKQVSEACDYIYKAIYILESVVEEESDAYDNLPESLKGSEMGEKMFEASEKMDEIKDSLEDFTTELEEVMA